MAEAVSTTNQPTHPVRDLLLEKLIPALRQSPHAVCNAFFDLGRSYSPSEVSPSDSTGFWRNTFTQAGLALSASFQSVSALSAVLSRIQDSNTQNSIFAPSEIRLLEQMEQSLPRPGKHWMAEPLFKDPANRDHLANVLGRIQDTPLVGIDTSFIDSLPAIFRNHGEHFYDTKREIKPAELHDKQRDVFNAIRRGLPIESKVFLSAIQVICKQSGRNPYETVANLSGKQIRSAHHVMNTFTRYISSFLDQNTQPSLTLSDESFSGVKPELGKRQEFLIGLASTCSTGDVSNFFYKHQDQSDAMLEAGLAAGQGKSIAYVLQRFGQQQPSFLSKGETQVLASLPAGQFKLYFNDSRAKEAVLKKSQLLGEQLGELLKFFADNPFHDLTNLPKIAEYISKLSNVICPACSEEQKQLCFRAIRQNLPDELRASLSILQLVWQGQGQSPFEQIQKIHFANLAKAQAGIGHFFAEFKEALGVGSEAPSA